MARGSANSRPLPGVGIHTGEHIARLTTAIWPAGIQRLSRMPKVPKSVTTVSRAKPPTLRVIVGWFSWAVLL